MQDRIIRLWAQASMAMLFIVLVAFLFFVFTR